MSLNETKKLSEIRSLVTRRKDEIMTEMDGMSTPHIDKKLCRQWLDQLYDIVLATDLSIVAKAHNQPIVGIDRCLAVDTSEVITIDDEEDEQPVVREPVIVKTGLRSKCSASGDSKATDKSRDCVDNKSLIATTSSGDNKTIDNSLQTKPTSSTSSMDNKITSDDQSSTPGTSSGRDKEDVRYKGEICTIDSLKGGRGRGRGRKRNTTATRQTRSGAKNAKKSEETEDDNNVEVFATDGHVLGGETQTDTSQMTPEEEREFRALMIEQRLQQKESRGAKGVVRLPTARSDTDNASAGYSNNSALRWQM